MTNHPSSKTGVAIYARVSTVEQSLDAQLHDLRECCRARGVSLDGGPARHLRRLIQAASRTRFGGHDVSEKILDCGGGRRARLARSNFAPSHYLRQLSQTQRYSAFFGPVTITRDSLLGLSP